MPVDFATLFLNGIANYGQGYMQKQRMDYQREQEQKLFDLRQQQGEAANADRDRDFFADMYKTALQQKNQAVGDYAAGKLSELTGDNINFQLPDKAADNSLYMLPNDPNDPIYAKFPYLKSFAGREIDLDKNLTALINSASRENDRKNNPPPITRNPEMIRIDESINLLNDQLSRVTYKDLSGQTAIMPGMEKQYKQLIGQLQKLEAQKAQLLRLPGGGAGFDSDQPEGGGRQPVNSKADVRNAIRGQGISLPEPGSNAPKPGTVEDGYRFKGGDPANPNNWEKVK